MLVWVTALALLLNNLTSVAVVFAEGEIEGEVAYVVEASQEEKAEAAQSAMPSKEAETSEADVSDVSTSASVPEAVEEDSVREPEVPLEKSDAADDAAPVEALESADRGEPETMSASEDAAKTTVEESAGDDGETTSDAENTEESDPPQADEAGDAQDDAGENVSDATQTEDELDEEPEATSDAEKAPVVNSVTFEVEGPAKVYVNDAPVQDERFTVEGSITFRVEAEDGAAVVSVSADHGVLTALEDGAYVLESQEGDAVVRVLAQANAPVEALALAVSTNQRYAVVDQKAIEFSISITGGTAPYTIFWMVDRAGETIYAEEAPEAIESASYMSAQGGDHIVAVNVTDGAGETASANSALPVSVDKRETRADWESTLPKLNQGMTYAEKLLRVAESQLGYRASQSNFIIDEDGECQAYTRYGDWAGRPYGDWSAVFVAFALRYADIPEYAVTRDDDAES